ncbi:YdcF family protein [Paraclostridium bifermentans]|uniref:YdcF family protein n=1 Tax=Paraclostridium bifermentans TaxID=1490 RepID=A0AA44DLS4_PARBF|nr:YdcF family protein [Paraclostridium bifermentans]MBN8047484.1 YdcF family protein [Paraclostridium bifermentans]NME09913.1 YdcF family protein [Paraclostridium bifermentans]
MYIYILIILASFLYGIFLFRQDSRNFFAGILLTFGSLGFLFLLVMYLSDMFDTIRLLSIFAVYAVIPLSIIVIGFFLIKNGYIMKHKEGRRLANLLSLILGVNVLLIVSLSLLLIFHGSKLNTYAYATILTIILFAIYFGFLFFSYLVYSYAYQMLPVNKNLDYVIVLGSGLIGDKVPPLLKSRLDKGIEIYSQQLSKGNHTKIVVSGGQGSDEIVPEAIAMKKYLVSQGIPELDILVEDKSTTTYENMKFSKNIMNNISKNYSCIFVSNNYHVFRASIYARKAGLKANGVGAPTAFYFLPSALIREYIAIIMLYKKVSLLAIAFILIVVAYSFIPFLYM